MKGCLENTKCTAVALTSFNSDTDITLRVEERVTSGIRLTYNA